MQAPTTPSEPSAQEPDERPCPGCGAANGASAAFCWQCYRPFAPVAATAAPANPVWGQAGAPRAPAGWEARPAASPFEAGPKAGGPGTMIAVALVTLAVIGGAWFMFFRDAAVALPGSFGGMSRIEDPQTKIAVDTFRSEVQANGIDGDMAIYGDGTPTAALIWIRDASVPTTDAAFDEFAAGFNQGIGSGGSLGQKETESRGGVTFVCAPVLGTTPGTICMWQEDDLFWLVFDFSGGSSADGQDLAVAARDAVLAA